MLFMQVAGFSLAEAPVNLEQEYPFIAEVNSDNINIRSDSTVSSLVISKINKGYLVEVVYGLYDWYKIRLPQNAPAFISKDFVDASEGETATVIKDNVNIRIAPDISSLIIGKADKDTEITIVGEEGDWYRIEPIKNSFGWLHKNFADKIDPIKLRSTKKKIFRRDDIVIEGILRPKTFTRIASHKLIDKDYRTYLLNGKKEELEAFEGRRVKITGKIIGPSKTKYPVIEVEKIETLD